MSVLIANKLPSSTRMVPSARGSSV